MLVTLLLAACVNEPASSVTPPPAAPPPGALLSVLQDQLGLSHAVVKRLHARTTDACAVVVDPEDPAGCDEATTCRAWAFTADGTTWRPAAIGTLGGLPVSQRCGDAGALGPLSGT